MIVVNSQRLVNKEQLRALPPVSAKIRRKHAAHFTKHRMSGADVDNQSFNEHCREVLKALAKTPYQLSTLL